MDGTVHGGAVRRAFTTQAEAFEDPAHNRILTTESEWLFERLALSGDELVLDVAAGTGHAARALARRARAAIALDATEAMLARGWAAVAAEGLRNVVLMRGEATSLPFLDGSFDVVVCRYAAHHLQAPADAIFEMARCVRPGGQVAVADMIVDDDPAVAAEQNRLERLRDPSHVRAATLAELRALLADAGLEPVHVDARAVVRPLAPWLEQAQTEPRAADAIATRLRAELAGGPPTGLRPRLVDGELHFTHRLAVCLARAPLAAGA